MSVPSYQSADAIVRQRSFLLQSPLAGWAHRLSSAWKPTLARMLIARTEINNLPRHGALRDVPRLAVAEVLDAPGAVGAALIPLFETVL